MRSLSRHSGLRPEPASRLGHSASVTAKEGITLPAQFFANNQPNVAGRKSAL